MAWGSGPTRMVRSSTRSDRAGDHAEARRELARALALLQREDASRVLFFGGGFNRDALLALCRAELVASGGSP